MEHWDIPNTRATRILLQEGERPLLLYYDDNRFWQVVAYKTREQRDHELCEAHDKRRIEEQKPTQELPAKTEESWIARTVRLAKEKAEAEKQNVDPMQKEYDALRTALTDIHANALKQRVLDAPSVRNQIQEAIKAEERVKALRMEKEEIERQIDELLEQERKESERLEQERLEQERLEQERLEQERLEQERLEEERLEQLAKQVETITLQEMDGENVSEYIPEDLVRSLDYGNVAQNYFAIHNTIRQRIGIK
jgi:type I site-specific restriction-modification system R (restriction) subunit